MDLLSKNILTKAVPEQADALTVEFCRGNLFDWVRPLANAGIVESGGQFRRLIAQGGVCINGVRAGSMEEAVETGDVLRIGKRKFVRIERKMKCSCKNYV